MNLLSQVTRLESTLTRRESTRTRLLTAADMAKLFSRAKADRMEKLLQSLTVLGSAREVAEGKYVSA